MKSVEGILKLVDNELDSIVSNGKFRSREEVDTAHKLIEIAEGIYCIWKYEDEGESGFSEYGSYDDGSYESRRSYRNGGGGRSRRGMSGARYGSRNSGESRRGSYEGSSYRRGGYSRGDARQEYIEELRELMEEAPDDQSRQSIQRMITQMEQQM